MKEIEHKRGCTGLTEEIERGKQEIGNAQQSTLSSRPFDLHTMKGSLLGAKHLAKHAVTTSK